MIPPQCEPYMHYFYPSFESAAWCYGVCFISLRYQMLRLHVMSAAEDWMQLEHWWNDTERENQNNQRKIYSRATYHTWTGLELILHLHSQKQGTNCQNNVSQSVKVLCIFMYWSWLFFSWSFFIKGNQILYDLHTQAASIPMLILKNVVLPEGLQISLIKYLANIAGSMVNMPLLAAGEKFSSQCRACDCPRVHCFASVLWFSRM